MSGLYLMSMNKRIPDFIIAGAAKSATTWWQHVLHAHPSIYIPLDELHYFSFDYDPTDLLSIDYLANFDKAEPGQLVGENSNSYLPHPGCAERINQSLPEIKIIVSLRNPIARAYSDWEMRVRQGLHIRETQAFLDPDHVPDFEFLRKGLYAHQLASYLSVFGKERVLVLVADDLKVDCEIEYLKVCRYLGVDERVPLDKLDQAVNTRDQKAVFPHLRRRIAGTRIGAPIIQVIRKSPLRCVARGLFARPQHAPPMPGNIRVKLQQYYRNDVEQLSELLDRDLTHWLK